MNIRVIAIVCICFLWSCNNIDPMPKDFCFQYSFDYTEGVNSHDSLYYRLYNSGDTAIKISFSTEEMQEIYLVIAKNHAMQMPDKFEPSKESICIAPAPDDDLWIQMNNIKKKIKYSHACPPKDQVTAEKFLEIGATIRAILYKKKKIQELPKSDMMAL